MGKHVRIYLLKTQWGFFFPFLDFTVVKEVLMSFLVCGWTGSPIRISLPVMFSFKILKYLKYYFFTSHFIIAGKLF